MTETKKTKVKKWTPEDEETLRNIHHLYTRKELAEFFGCTVYAIKSKVRRLGLVKREYRELLPGNKLKCSMCGEIKDVNEFYKNRTSKVGRASACIVCTETRRKLLQIQRKEDKVKNERETKIREFIERHKDDKLFCKKCDKYLEHDECTYIYRKKSQEVFRRCKKCEYERTEQVKFKRLKKRGY